MSGLVEVSRFEKLHEAHLARAYLESYGLEAVVFDADEGAPVGVRLMVLEEDFREVKARLSEYDF